MLRSCSLPRHPPHLHVGQHGCQWRRSPPDGRAAHLEGRLSLFLTEALWVGRWLHEKQEIFWTAIPSSCASLLRCWKVQYPELQCPLLAQVSLNTASCRSPNDTFEARQGAGFGLTRIQGQTTSPWCEQGGR